MKEENANRGYIVVSKKIIGDNRLSAFDRLFLIRIGSFGEYFESTKEAANYFEVSERTILESKRRLVTARCIIESKNHGRGKSYIINEKYLWKTSPKSVEKYV